MTSSNLVGWATPKPGPLGEQNVLSRCSRPVEFLFASDGTLQTKLSYFFGCIDFAPCDGEIDSGHYRSGRGYFRAAACAAKKRTTDAKESIFVRFKPKARSHQWRIN
jgi:hypothetical protein